MDIRNKITTTREGKPSHKTTETIMTTRAVQFAINAANETAFSTGKLTVFISTVGGKTMELPISECDMVDYEDEGAYIVAHGDLGTTIIAAEHIVSINF